jgi:hypothetical protein
MPYSEIIDLQIASTISNWGTERKKMFGGTCYLVNGNMMCGVYKDYLILRLGETQAEEALGQPHVRQFDITGRPMKGWVMVGESGFEGAALEKWLSKARHFAESLPPK